MLALQPVLARGLALRREAYVPSPSAHSVPNDIVACIVAAERPCSGPWVSSERPRYEDTSAGLVRLVGRHIAPPGISQPLKRRNAARADDKNSRRDGAHSNCKSSRCVRENARLALGPQAESQLETFKVRTREPSPWQHRLRDHENTAPLQDMPEHVGMTREPAQFNVHTVARSVSAKPTSPPTRSAIQ